MRKLVVLCLAVGLAGASNFYIFYKQIGAYPNCPGLSIDAHRNAPAQRQWQMDSSGNFSEVYNQGDFLIRAVLDWTPEDTNAAAVWFGYYLPKDTSPNITYPIRPVIKNMGKDTLPVGTRVVVSITGPNSYSYCDTATTSAKLAHRATAQLNYSPTWHIPNVAGVYSINCWTDAAGEQWRADDTISYNLNCLNWIQYHTDAQLHWLTWAAPERAVKFHPADFSLQYPIKITSVRADFYQVDTMPWPDSSFSFKIYAGDGKTLLYQSETLKATPGKPGPYRRCDLDSTVVIDSGDFYVSVAPVSSTGEPATCGDSSVGGHSYWGSPGNWYLWDPDTSQSVGGDLFIAAVARGSFAVGEGKRRSGPIVNMQYTVPDRPVAGTCRVNPPNCQQSTARIEVQRYTILDPQPDAFSPCSPLRVLGTADTLKYDDGTPAGHLAGDSAGGGWGVKFISPAESVTLAGALVHFYSGWPTPGDTWASFRVYKDDGVDGAPGTLLYSLDSVNIMRGAWNFIQLAPVGIAEGAAPRLNRPALQITNSPNPVTDQAKLKWQVPTCMPVAVNLYDATGRLVRNLYSANDKARVGTLTIDTRSLAAGIYLVRLETAEGSATRKVVIDR